jgi:hypothetical protein
MKRALATAALALLAMPAMALTPSAVGVPHVGVSAGPYCNGVVVGDTLFAVPNSDSNAVAMLLDLSAAEARSQSISAFTPHDLGAGMADTQCYSLTGTGPIGAVLPHLFNYK